MNCFNIRELQGILKRKFFVDLVNSHDHKSILEESMVGMRYKANQSLNTDLDYTTFYNFGLHTSKTRDNINYTFYGNQGGSSSRVFIDSTSYSILKVLDTLTPQTAFGGLVFSNFFSKLYNTTLDLLSVILSLNPFSSLLTALNLRLVLDAFLVNFNFFYGKFNVLDVFTPTKDSMSANEGLYKFSKDVMNDAYSGVSTLSESTQTQRFTRFSNPLINYDYKTGNYIGNWESQYPYLINSFIEVARGIRKPN
jgi:hypothetical protein